MVFIKKRKLVDGSIQYHVFPESRASFVECKELLLKMKKSCCSDGFLVLAHQVTLTGNHMPVFTFTVDRETWATKKNENGVYELCEYKDAENYINITEK